MYMYVVNFWRLQIFAVYFVLFLTFFIISVHTNENVEYPSSYSYIPTPETSKGDLCVNTNSSCSHQVVAYGGNQDSCSFIRYENSSEECTSSNFKGDLDPDDSYGKVILSAYIQYNSYAIIVFNVTFTDIKWTRAKLRFYESGSKVPAICREFQLTSSIPSETILFFDCPWKINEYKAYYFQYIAYPQSGDSAVAHQFVFFAPSVPLLGRVCRPSCPDYVEKLDMKRLQVFVSVDVSILPVLKLVVQTAHETYNITSYQVQLVRTWVDHKWPVLNAVVSVLPNQTQFFVVYNTDYRPGVYNFSVTPLHESCKGPCSPSRAPGILIVASTETPLLIAMVVTVLLIPLLIAFYFMWRRTCVPRPTGNEPWQPPKVLLVYNPDYKSHVSDMIRFTEYLKRKCRVEPMFDLFCIPNSASRDPTIWYIEAFEKADFVLVFAPPDCDKSSEPHEWNPYLNLNDISLSQLRLFMARNRIIFNRFRLKFVGSRQIFSVKLPGCSWDKLCSEAVHLQRFSLPKDLERLMKNLNVGNFQSNKDELTVALSTEVSRIPHPLPSGDTILDVPVDLTKSVNEEPQRPQLLQMNLMGIDSEMNDKDLRRRSNSCDALIDKSENGKLDQEISQIVRRVQKRIGAYFLLKGVIFGQEDVSTQDPTKWYREAFRQADFILVFASPPGPKSTEPHKCNPYLHLDKIALNQLRIMLAVPGPSCRVVSVLLPGCSWETLPPEATRLRQFTIPRDLDPLLVCLGAAPQCDGGESFREALANDIRPDPQPLPQQTEPVLQVTRKCISSQQDELCHQSSELSKMNVMGTPSKELEPEVQRRPRRDDTLLDIGDLNLSGGC